MKRKTLSACRDAMLALIKRPEGFRSVELKATFPQGSMQKSLIRLVADGQAFPARMSARHVRYFATAKEAEFYQSQRRLQPRADRPHGRLVTHFNARDEAPTRFHHQPGPMPGSGQLLAIGNNRRGGAHWNPKAREGDPDYVEPHYPVDDQGQPLYRITRGPAPQPATRSNTHAE